MAHSWTVFCSTENSVASLWYCQDSVVIARHSFTVSLQDQSSASTALTTSIFSDIRDRLHDKLQKVMADCRTAVSSFKVIIVRKIGTGVYDQVLLGSLKNFGTEGRRGRQQLVPCAVRKFGTAPQRATFFEIATAPQTARKKLF